MGDDEIERELARGGMCAVYVATDTKFDDLSVAVKVARGQGVEGAEQLRPLAGYLGPGFSGPGAIVHARQAGQRLHGQPVVGQDAAIVGVLRPGPGHVDVRAFDTAQLAVRNARGNRPDQGDVHQVRKPPSTGRQAPVT